MARILVHVYGIAFLQLGGMGFGFHGPRSLTIKRCWIGTVTADPPLPSIDEGTVTR